MENEAFERFERETRSFAALALLNIVGAGLAMAFSVSWIVNNLLPLASGGAVYLDQIVLAGLGLAGFVFAMRWLIPCAETFGGVDDMIKGKSRGKIEANGDKLTEMIVEKMAWYRESRETIGRLKLGSRLTGVFFLASAALQIYNLAVSLSTVTQAILVMSAVGLTLCLAFGAVGLLVPTYVDRFIGTWDQRVKASDEAEDKLGKLIEGP